jgi:cytoskeletal protein CcmA (bactofilin family)
MSFWNKLDSPNPDAAPRPPDAKAEPAIVRPPEPPPGRTEPSPARAEPPAARAEPSPPRADGGLRLGRGVRFEGKLTFSGTVRIDATFQGSIVTDGVLVVGDQAKVDADITCGSVVVEGEVNGNVTAKETVELRRTSRLRGDVETPALSVERGAIFEGASRRPAASASPRAGKAAAAPAPSAH